jgi:dTDP-4-amino-4,6-dideoxygalactose transaminase
VMLEKKVPTALESLREDYLVFGSPQLLEEEIEEVVATLRSGWIGTGPRVHAFEEEFSAYVGGRHAAALSSCTAGLHLAMLVLGLPPGAEVIVPAMTFAATANAVIHAGGVPVFADVDRLTGCLSPTDVERRITERTFAVIPVHFAGRSCPMDDLLSLARERDLRVIEDCAHAIETLYHGTHAGLLGDIGVFSFYVTKNVVTGEGGMAVTGDQDLAARLKVLALHGLSADAWSRFSETGFKHYEVTEPGFKYNMMDIQAALGLHQLRRVEDNLVRRAEIWSRYDEAFAGLPVFLPPPEEEGTRHARHLYTLLIDVDRLGVGRDEVQAALHDQRIGTGIHYRALHLHRYYRERWDLKPEDYPNAAWISDRTISLPLSPKLSDADVDDVVEAVQRVLEHFSA